MAGTGGARAVARQGEATVDCKCRLLRRKRGKEQGREWQPSPYTHSRTTAASDRATPNHTGATNPRPTIGAAYSPPRPPPTPPQQARQNRARPRTPPPPTAVLPTRCDRASRTAGAGRQPNGRLATPAAQQGPRPEPLRAHSVRRRSRHRRRVGDHGAVRRGQGWMRGGGRRAERSAVPARGPPRAPTGQGGDAG